MGAIIPFHKPDPQSFRELFQDRVPVYVRRLLAQGGPQEANWQAARTFTAILGPKGDEMQLVYEAGTKKHQEVASQREEMARHVAAMAFLPNGIRVFGLHIQVVDGNLSIESAIGVPGAFYPERDRNKAVSHYTPRDLIECLLDTALEPVMEDAIARSSYPRIQANARQGILINLARRIQQTREE
jgi:hypothetical protein